MSLDERPIVLVACCGPKLPHAAPAQDLYQSMLFKKARAYAEREGAGWYILSALHGVVEPQTVIEPYNVRLNTLTKGQRDIWKAKVARQLAEHGLAGRRLVILAGIHYRAWVPAWRARSGGIDLPLEGMQIGYQMQWLTQANARQAVGQ
jgi:hypothetical protein